MHTRVRCTRQRRHVPLAPSRCALGTVGLTIFCVAIWGLGFRVEGSRFTVQGIGSACPPAVCFGHRRVDHLLRRDVGSRVQC